MTVDLGAGTSTGGSGTDTLKHIEDVSGSDFDDTLTGESGANIIYGEDGNDTMSGGAGNADGADSFDGGGGIDTVDYGKNTSTHDRAPCRWGHALRLVRDRCSLHHRERRLGWDRHDPERHRPRTPSSAPATTRSRGRSSTTPCGRTAGRTRSTAVLPLLFGCGIDTVNYSQGYTAGVTVNLAGGGPSGGNADSIVGFTNAVGTAFADNIIGTDLNIGNSLKGGKGNDTISGNNGPDFVLGGAGNDAIRGGAGERHPEGSGWQGQHQRRWWCRRHLRRQGQGLL